MNYGDEIIAVLYEAGNDGLSVHKIAIHIHNAHNTLFSPIAFAEVRLKVQTWLLRNSLAKFNRLQAKWHQKPSLTLRRIVRR